MNLRIIIINAIISKSIFKAISFLFFIHCKNLKKLQTFLFTLILAEKLE